MAVREYIGARYVPIFGRPGESSAAWDNSAPYEPLTVVIYQGNSFTSRQYVPAGVDITNGDYWAETGNWNSQIESYRQEVLTYDGRITANADDIDDLGDDLATETANRIQGDADVTDAFEAADAAIDAKFGDNISAEHTVRDALDNLRSHYDNMIGTGFSASNSVRDEIDRIGTRGIIIISDSYAAGSTSGVWVATWPVDVKNALGADLENLSVPGAGWVQDRNGTTFLTMCETARDNATFADYDKVDIIIYGGINDLNAGVSTSTLKQNMRNGIRALRQTYPNAHIHVAGINLSNQAISRYLWPDYYAAWEKETWEASGNVTFYDARGWLCSDNNSYAADNLHPNGDHGNDLLKVKWLSILQGNESHYTVVVDATDTTDGTSSNDWMLNVLRHCKLSCCEGRYKFIPYRYEDFTTLNAATGYAAADVGKQYSKGYIQFTGVYQYPDPRSTNERFNQQVIDMTFIHRATQIPFKPFVMGSGDLYYVWWEVSRPAPDTTPTLDSNCYAFVNGEWSIFGN